MGLEQGDIAVVGAGVIGLMTSLSLLDAGRSVTLIDPDPPGQGASFGNAGVIANYGVKPLAEPSLLLTGPGLLFKKDGPLAIQPGAGRAVIPWLTQFVRACLPWHQERLQRALAAVIVDADARWHDVIHRVDASDEW
ncbi:MAG: FAD-dependent oxidoreductase, partial [Pseudomonadales bacterium]